MGSLQNLIQYELSEGLTEHEVAEDIGVSKHTIHGILRGRNPKSPDILKKLARYFHMDVAFLRFGEFAFAHSHQRDEVELLVLSRIERCLSTLGLRSAMSWDSRAHYLSWLIMVDTELSGARVFAMHVEDDSMERLFHEKEIIFVHPGLRP